ncbi:TPA: CRISPR-associated helicase/endonuclease Cas3 [Clostridioides difficile]|uniref:CRISPR-associated helicase/endonuclease Cas3 n=1 Tax=Clostridioides difficile TaxID=1496 RepID=A0AAN5VLQ1_CLODI|nr:CRISPR-associated helicase/endonuclease Cas3 [Clostridioides difficile]EGT3944008.1 CRISPR-associated helicase/endonuclease Cas3 [Clostridioides difficile]MBG0197956.1 CRISPR-associated helicase/endonuclease Cas3 [Clostridioides difficile]MCA0574612.1 CRISPR-associated helicase/endonuclease Cas3 [Clostridioides difficile]MCM0739720.1 CRISPR-associated helicase/endonuclease Cas3 [Clostridioides difficile]MDW0076918.1 CRISPR-associated helicase/endonuclease Cas3 [Clostridioides difficile]
MNLEKIIKSNKYIYSHKSEDEEENILLHLDRTKCVFFQIDSKYKILNKLRKTYGNLKFKLNELDFYLSEEAINLIENMFLYSVYLHDIGKINPKYQSEKMKNNFEFLSEEEKSTLCLNKIVSTNHSYLSSIVYIDLMQEKIDESKNISTKEKIVLYYLMLVNANIISRHHSNQSNLEYYFAKLEREINNAKMANYLYFYNKKLNINYEKISKAFINIKKIKFDETSVYIWNKILNSLLISCDFIATHSFYSKKSISEFKINCIEGKENIKDIFYKNPIYKGIESYKLNNRYFEENNLPKINELRSDILIESNNNLDKNNNERIFNIESPTGSGKTINSLSCALKLIKDGSKLFYVFPVNTLAEQTEDVLNGIFKGKLNTQIINSISPLPIKSTDKKIDYNKVLLDRQILNYESILTSNITLFNLFFGCGREQSMGLFSLFDSVIILDEIQNYKNLIWKEIVEFLYKFSEIMDFKLIIMSATLPNLEELMDFEDKKFINLIENPKIYYNNKLFKDRVSIENKLLNETVDFKKLLDLIKEEVNIWNKEKKEYAKFLIEFITKKTAQEFYMYVSKKLNNYTVFELDGDDNKIKKQSIINHLKKDSKELKSNILLITTQVIEAGVDIDMDLGAKDTSFPDLDEQFIGRINRSCLKEGCKAFLFNLDMANIVYKNDYRLVMNIDKNKDNYLKCLSNKDFSCLYDKVFNKINLTKGNWLCSEIDVFYKDLKMIRNKDISKHMKLIDINSFEIFIPTIIDGVDGEEVWSEYVELVSNIDMEYAERKVKMINLKEKLEMFTFSIKSNKSNKLNAFGGFYYIKNGNKFIANDKFDSSRFKKEYMCLLNAQ